MARNRPAAPRARQASSADRVAPQNQPGATAATRRNSDPALRAKNRAADRGFPEQKRTRVASRRDSRAERDRDALAKGAPSDAVTGPRNDVAAGFTGGTSGRSSRRRR
jgi:hypothetical protein